MSLLLGGEFELDTTLFELRRHGHAVPLEPQAFDVLVHLVAHRDRVVPKEELMDTVWGGRFVSETAVTSRIKQVRRALGDDGQAQRFVRTLHGRGYRFVAEVTEPTAESSTSPPPPGSAEPRKARPPVHHTVSDGLHIAYQVTGGGDIDIVLIPGFISHLELDWDDPRHAHFLDSLGEMGRLIRFDKRGTGMSDRPAGVPDLETRMHDVLAVMDAVGSERAVVIGYSEGGPMAVLFSAMHPQRVSSLVLYASYARRAWAPDYPWGRTPEERERYVERLVTGWDWETDMLMRAPSADRAMQEWWGRRMRAAATPGTVRALINMNDLVDVREVLPTVRVPTLVLHRRDDALVSSEESEYIAQRIPGAAVEVLEGADHFVSGDPQQLIDAIGPFVASQRAGAHHRVLAAVAVPHGPDAALVLEALVRAGGRCRTGPGGEDVVLFDGPATAVRAAKAGLVDGVRAAVGVSVAEVSAGGMAATGPGVDLAVEVARTAPTGRVVASATVGLLLPGSGIVLEPLPDASTFLVTSA